MNKARLEYAIAVARIMEEHEANIARVRRLYEIRWHNLPHRQKARHARAQQLARKIKEQAARRHVAASKLARWWRSKDTTLFNDGNCKLVLKIGQFKLTIKDAENLGGGPPREALPFNYDQFMGFYDLEAYFNGRWNDIFAYTDWNDEELSRNFNMFYDLWRKLYSQHTYDLRNVSFLWIPFDDAEVDDLPVAASTDGINCAKAIIMTKFPSREERSNYGDRRQR